MSGAFEPSTEKEKLPADGPPFSEPWQARAFALVVHLCRSGRFAWGEWVATFSRQITAHPARAGECTNDTYYRQWLAALEELMAAKGLVDPAAARARQGEWRGAYLNTPHGQPVSLGNAACPPEHAHEHLAPCRLPVTVSAASNRRASI
ncbi:TPA: nitrile hydratase accessory protein [Burkholderia cenocepacia]|uniref:nitrile hydratase accessory protein n=1 Tax=unclassified Burkholderia TaxID=2613784 RepID=UPI00158C81D2|nr:MULTISPECIES: nitrile hydratase accessory protein [unclassified Burkholderia]HEF5870455.1 nitrile hydratase accessory protein [Burkholderia cenocepacia]